VVDEVTLASAASRVESAPMSTPPPKPAGSAGGNHANIPKPQTSKPAASPSSPPAPSKPAPTKPALHASPRPAPAELPPEPSPIAGPPQPPWHGLGSGRDGETVAPIAGVVTDVLVKVGDTVRLSEALLRIQATGTMGASARPLIGTLRAVGGGTVKDVLAQKGDAVAPGQVLIRIG
jgi:biotin carboxyl carrier protein